MLFTGYGVYNIHVEMSSDISKYLRILCVRIKLITEVNIFFFNTHLEIIITNKITFT